MMRHNRLNSFFLEHLSDVRQADRFPVSAMLDVRADAICTLEYSAFLLVGGVLATSGGQPRSDW